MSAVPVDFDLLDQLSTSVLVVTADASIVDMNPATEQLIGTSRRRAVGTSLLERLPCVAEDIKSMINGALEQQISFAQDLTLQGNPTYPEDRVVDCRVTPHEAHSRSHVIVEFSDITRRVRVHRENMLLQQHGASRRMVRQLAHEIKNPLGGIRGAAQLLSRQFDDDADLKRYTEVIVAEVDRLAGLADTLLGPGQQTNKRPVNVHDLLEHVARLVEPQDDASSIELVRAYDPGLPYLTLDRDQIIQAILNIVNNALAVLPAGGTLVLRTRAAANFTIGDRFHRVIASIEIEDNGPGIADEIRDSVFFPLVTSRPDGTGIGLPLAQELVNRHGGLIEFATRPGRTVFYIRLPIQ
ncbi:MAG: nitrogen regulation protein NR(II) [Pseudomonadota bacterium]